MDPISTNPFAVMTFIVAPAILTNAASVMGLQTANRFARAIDRARDLSKQIEGRLGDPDPEIALRTRQLESAEHRALILVRALTAFYLAIGAFALASLASLFGAIFHLAHEPISQYVALSVALCSGVTGVAGLTYGSALVVWETRRSLAILMQDTKFARARRSRIVTGDRPDSPMVG
jgi:hypothetical protein